MAITSSLSMQERMLVTLPVSPLPGNEARLEGYYEEQSNILAGKRGEGKRWVVKCRTTVAECRKYGREWALIEMQSQT